MPVFPFLGASAPRYWKCDINVCSELLRVLHWTVIKYMRKVFEKNGQPPSIRKLTKESGVDTKELYALFPKGPAKKAAKIGGLPKPVGCI